MKSYSNYLNKIGGFNKNKSRTVKKKSMKKRNKTKKNNKKGGVIYHKIKLDIDNLNIKQRELLTGYFRDYLGMDVRANKKIMNNGSSNVKVNVLKNYVIIPFNIVDRATFGVFIRHINLAFRESNPPVKFKLYFNEEEIDLNIKVSDYFINQRIEGNNVIKSGPVLKLEFDYN